MIAATIQRGAADLERLRKEFSASSPKRKQASTADTEMEMQKRLEQLRSAKLSQDHRHRTAMRKFNERLLQQRQTHKIKLARLRAVHKTSLDKLRRQVKLLKKRRQR